MIVCGQNWKNWPIKKKKETIVKYGIKLCFYEREARSIWREHSPGFTMAWDPSYAASQTLPAPAQTMQARQGIRPRRSLVLPKYRDRQFPNNFCVSGDMLYH